MDEFDLYISPEDENDVILISKDGRPFTVGSTSTNTMSVNSHIKVESPSVSSTSPRSSSHTVPTKPALHIPIPPPLPTHPAPAPLKLFLFKLPQFPNTSAPSSKMPRPPAVMVKLGRRRA
ncbi:hypothetical protein BYT27DRAFT_6754483 [Phlegmacium glaucopus]|nr:hypothetical protein BYT27DRAFT_6754483 [Phlegmacium glaucopus]